MLARYCITVSVTLVTDDYFAETHYVPVWLFCLMFCYYSYHHECWVLNSADGSSRIELNVDYFWIDLVGDAVNIYDGKICRELSQLVRFSP